MYFTSSSIYISAVVTIQLLLIHIVSCLNITNVYLNHKCIASEGKYQRGSEYEKNLNTLIKSTSAGTFRSGFDQVSHGKSPHSVTFMYQCRGDSYGPRCRSCYTTALSALRKRCPRNKGRIIWYDQCLIEISSTLNDGKVDYNNNFCMSNSKNASGSSLEFKQKMVDFLLNLGMKATSEDNMDENNQAVLYATGEERVGTNKLYAMVQCTKDLWLKTCYACLEWIVLKESDCCDGKLGGRVLSTSCNYRYELYPFIKPTV